MVGVCTQSTPNWWSPLLITQCYNGTITSFAYNDNGLKRKKGAHVEHDALALYVNNSGEVVAQDSIALYVNNSGAVVEHDALAVYVNNSGVVVEQDSIALYVNNSAKTTFEVTIFPITNQLYML